MIRSLQRFRNWTFSLKALVVVVLLLQVPLIYYAYLRQRISNERRAMEQIKTEIHDYRRAPFVYEALNDRWIVNERDPAYNRFLKWGIAEYFYPVTSIHVHRVQLSQDNFDALAMLPDIVELDLRKCEIDPEVVLPAEAGQSLKSVNLGEAIFGPKLLKSLSQCPQLQTLVLSECTLSQAHLKAVSQLRGIRNLVISESMLSEGGWDSLHSLKSLTRLSALGISDWPQVVSSLPPSIRFAYFHHSTAPASSTVQPKKTLSLESVGLYSAEVSFEQLEALSRSAPNLQGVNLFGASIKPEEIARVSKLHPTVTYGNTHRKWRNGAILQE